MHAFPKPQPGDPHDDDDDDFFATYEARSL